MAETVCSFRVTDEDKAEINQLIEDSGMTAKDFLLKLKDIYKLEITKKSTPEIGQDIEELQSLLSRISNIYINIGERTNNLLKQKDIEGFEHIKKKEDIIYTLQDKMEKLTEENESLRLSQENAISEKAEIQKEMQKIVQEYQSKIANLEDMNKSDKELITEYKEKIVSLSGMVNEYKSSMEQIQELKDELSSLKSSIVDYQNKIKMKEIEINSLVSRVEQTKEQNEFELDKLREKLTMEKDRSLLQAEKSFQVQLQDVHADYNNRIKELINSLSTEK